MDTAPSSFEVIQSDSWSDVIVSTTISSRTSRGKEINEIGAMGIAVVMKKRLRTRTTSLL